MCERVRDLFLRAWVRARDVFDQNCDQKFVWVKFCDNFVTRWRLCCDTYFVVNCWRKPYYIYLIRRNSEEAVELAQFELPSQYEKDVCELKGVYALEDDVKAWLKSELGE